jgi:predicted ribosome quality control (RQC) complex YloA/Tae2 family protein
MSVSIEELLKKVKSDVAALEGAIEADKSEDQSEIRKEMGKIYKQLVAVLPKAQALADKAQNLVNKADAARKNAQNFFESADELATTLEAASEAMDPDQWDWGGEEENHE